MINRFTNVKEQNLKPFNCVQKKEKRSKSFKDKGDYKLFVYMYKEDLVLNNHQG